MPETFDPSLSPPAAAAPLPPAQNRTGMAVLYLAMLVCGMAQALVFILIPLVGRELKLHELVFTLPALGLNWQPRELAITALTALTSVIFSVFAPIWGRLSDRWGRRSVLIIGMLGYGIGSLLFNLVAELALAGLLGGVVLYGALALARAIYAALMAGATPTGSAYIADITNPAQRAGGIGKLNAATQFGGMLGPLVTAFAAVSLLAPLYIYAGITALAALLLWRFLPESAPRISHHKPRARLGYNDRRYRHLLVVGFVMCAMMGEVQSTLVFYFQDTLQLDTMTTAARFSVAMMISSFAMVFAQLIVVQRFGWSSLRLLQIGVPVTLLADLLLANAGGLYTLWCAMALFGLGMGLCLPGFAAITSLTVGPAEQGALAGIMSGTIGWGFLFGPLLGGYLYGQHHTLPYWCAALVLLPLSVVVWRQKL